MRERLRVSAPDLLGEARAAEHGRSRRRTDETPPVLDVRPSSPPRSGDMGRVSRAGTVQCKLAVGAVDDPAEAEADRMADAAMHHLATRNEVAEPAEQPRIRRSARAGAGATPLDAGTQQAIDAERPHGRPLGDRVRRSMETGFGADFSSVRIHQGGTADRLSAGLQARAFTTGSDIFFRSGEYRPGTASGDHLLAHELAHTVQQGVGQVRRRSDGVIRRKLTVDNTVWTDASSIKATSITQGQTGVFFLSDKSGATIIVKPVNGLARAQFGNDVMEAAGAETVGQRGVALASPEGQQLLKVMRKLASKYRVKNKTAKGQNPIKIKIQQQLESGANDGVLVMESYQNLSNMEELQDDANFQTMFPMMEQNGFYHGLGRVHAADMFMGNEDRLDKAHAKNIFVNLKTGQTVGLDTDVNAASFDQVTKDLKGGQSAASNRPSLAGNEYKDFVTYSIEGRAGKKDYTTKQGLQKTGPMGARGGAQAVSDMRLALDPARIDQTFTNFVDRLVEQAQIVGKGNDPFLQQYDWTRPRAQFKIGVSQGMQALMKKADALAAQASSLSQTHGADDFFDPMVFKIRTMYTQLLGHGVSDADARPILEMYAEHIHKGGTEDAFMTWIHRYLLETGSTATTTTLAPMMPAVPKRPRGRRSPTIKAKQRGKLAKI